MARIDIVAERLSNQGAIAPRFPRAEDVVERLCAVQAQDYRGALWGIALRTDRATEADVERAIEARAIVRSWPMRGTLHFVAAADIHWMRALLTPRIIARAKRRHDELEIDGAVLAKSGKVLERALHGGRALTRDEAYRTLADAKISPAGQRGIHILGHLAMHGLLCFGPRKERQPTFVLLDEWIPPRPPRDRDEALAELARRYFSSHGPATADDFAWWSGLAAGDARTSLDLASAHLVQRASGERTYWSAPDAKRGRSKPGVHLLPPYDEYTVAYRDRSAILDPARAARTRNGIFSPVVAIDGRLAGVWKRETKKGSVVIHAELFEATTASQRRALESAATRYGEFAGAPASLVAN